MEPSGVQDRYAGRWAPGEAGRDDQPLLLAGAKVGKGSVPGLLTPQCPWILCGGEPTLNHLGRLLQLIQEFLPFRPLHKEKDGRTFREICGRELSSLHRVRLADLDDLTDDVRVFGRSGNSIEETTGVPVHRDGTMGPRGSRYCSVP